MLPFPLRSSSAVVLCLGGRVRATPLLGLMVLLIASLHGSGLRDAFADTQAGPTATVNSPDGLNLRSDED